MMPGIVGRVYLFGKDIAFPLQADGSLYVELAEIDNGQPKVLEQWSIDALTMAKLQRKDAIGAGYSLFLPWGTYRPDISHVQLRVAFQPAKGGTPLYGAPSSVVLTRGDPFGGLSPVSQGARRP
jgi:hypothetical protein